MRVSHAMPLMDGKYLHFQTHPPHTLNPTTSYNCQLVHSKVNILYFASQIYIKFPFAFSAQL